MLHAAAASLRVACGTVRAVRSVLHARCGSGQPAGTIFTELSTLTDDGSERSDRYPTEWVQVRAARGTRARENARRACAPVRASAR